MEDLKGVKTMSEETQVQEQEASVEQVEEATPESFVDGPGNDAEAQDVIDDVLGAQSLEDPFGELMADAKENVPGVNEPEVQNPQEVEMAADEVEQPQDESFQYWQSQADKRAKELEEVKSRYQDLEEIAPIARYIRENPQVLNSVENSLSVNKPRETLQSYK